MRTFLIEKEVSLKIIFQLEQQFINAVISKDKSKFAKNVTIQALEGDVRSVIASFVASILFKMVFGV